MWLLTVISIPARNVTNWPPSTARPDPSTLLRTEGLVEGCGVVRQAHHERVRLLVSLSGIGISLHRFDFPPGCLTNSFSYFSSKVKRGDDKRTLQIMRSPGYKSLAAAPKNGSAFSVVKN